MGEKLCFQFSGAGRYPLSIVFSYQFLSVGLFVLFLWQKKNFVFINKIKIFYKITSTQ